ncbi:MAG: helix-turn-helix transcriptional regulator [Rhodoferax sp.]|nr:helix-turn-helix transcriptional regulator [Rhodoferax sp.]MBP9737335.1 helix-turn-helix transcriptional regulator [Rhodoferax sp.]
MITCSQRESEVLHLLMHGLSNKSIASRLGISPHTARDHISCLMGRYGLASRVELVAYASLRRWQISGQSDTYQLTVLPKTAAPTAERRQRAARLVLVASPLHL